MKTLIVTALLLLSFTTTAGTIFVTPNTAGGLIHLTDEPCSDTMDVVYSRIPGGGLIVGCWRPRPHDNAIFVIWQDGGASMYDIRRFKPTPYFKRTYK